MNVASISSKLIKNNHENKHSKKVLNIKTKEMAEKINDPKRKGSISETPEINETELLIKSNKRKHNYNHQLGISSVSNKPILKIDTSEKKPAVNLSPSNVKRLQSLHTFKKNYQNQKLLIQTALSKVDNSPKNKIIFEDNLDSVAAENLVQKKKFKKTLFDDNQSEDEEFEGNFCIKEQFQSTEGQKLLELQSKYKNDKRFVLDSRFLDNNEAGDEKVTNEAENEKNSLEEEKKKEYEILEQVLGKDISKSLHKNKLDSQKKAMLRFDPTQPEHSKFEIKEDVKKKKKRKSSDDKVEVLSKKITEEKELPTVSKETFYKVTDNLKESLHKQQGFSLLNMFGKVDEREDQNTEQFPKNLSTNTITKEANPFKYDSSDDEDEMGQIPDKNVLETEKSSENHEPKINSRTSWTEPFFFKDDDYRLQEGYDFIEKMRSEENTDFSKLRRDLKEIVKAKVRNVQRKHKPFKKKLGGNKRRRMLRMKKALKR